MGVSKTTTATLAMALSACMWGFIGYFTRNMSDMGMSAIQITFTRMFIGLIVLALVLLVVDKTCFRIKRKDLWVFIFFGIFKILSDVFLFGAQVRIHLSLSTVLQLTSPFWALLIGVTLFKESLTVKKLLSIGLAFFGCILLTGLLQKDVSFDTYGVILGILSGISYATYSIGNKVMLDRGYSANTVLFYVFLISVIICVPFSDVWEIPGMIHDVEDIWYILGMSLLMTLLAYYLQIYATKYIAPFKILVIALLEVASSVVVGFILYDETLEILNFVGLALIPIAIIIMNFNPHNPKMPKDSLK